MKAQPRRRRGPDRAGAAAITLAEIARAGIVVEPRAWPFAAARRAEIDRHFAARRRAQPALWNGRVLLLHRCELRGDELRGACFETDYANLLAWRDWEFPDRDVFNIFAVAALRGADGGYVLGEMAPSTAAAGQIYFPCGTPDPGDIDRGGTLDLAGSLRRELAEETGLDIDTLDAAPGWRLVRDRGYVALMKTLASRETAEQLCARIRRHLASEEEPELSDVCIVRGPADLSARMPEFLSAFLDAVWQEEAGSPQP